MAENLSKLEFCFITLVEQSVLHIKIDALSFLYIHVFLGYKFCSCLIENRSIFLGVPSRNIRNFSRFSVAGKNFPLCQMCTSVCGDIDIFSEQIRSLKEISRQ